MIVRSRDLGRGGGRLAVGEELEDQKVRGLKDGLRDVRHLSFLDAQMKAEKGAELLDGDPEDLGGFRFVVVRFSAD